MINTKWQYTRVMSTPYNYLEACPENVELPNRFAPSLGSMGQWHIVAVCQVQNYTLEFSNIMTTWERLLIQKEEIENVEDV